MNKWKLGLLGLGIVTLGLFVYVIVQGVSSKQDRATFKTATTIAAKLNNYVNDKQTIPASLGAAGITNLPNTVSYTKKSSTQYQFCVTYKASSTDVTGRVAQDLTNATIYRGLNTGGSSYGLSSSSDVPSDAYVDPNHKAGKQCQTVEPYFYGDSGSYNYYDSSSDGTNYYNYDSSITDPSLLSQ